MFVNESSVDIYVKSVERRCAKRGKGKLKNAYLMRALSGITEHA